MAAIASITSYEYAAGTCTLRLVGEHSPLSQVTGQPVLGRSRFHLQLHGAEAPEAAPNPTVIFEVSGREPQFSALVSLVQTYVQHHLSADDLATGGSVSRDGSSLQAVGLTRHRLALALPPDAPKAVELSTLQLADLAEALEQADSNLQIIPDNALPKRRALPKLPLWLGSVAAVGIAALLGNQLLTNVPSAVVLSPRDSQAPREETFQPPPNNASNSQTPLEESAPTVAADGIAESAAELAEDAPAAGAALPAPVTTAPTTPAAAPDVPPRASRPSPQPAGTAPAQTTELPQANTAATTPAETQDRGQTPPETQAEGQRPSPSADTAADQGPAAQNSATLRTARPDSFEPEAGVVAPAAPDSDLAWVSNLTQALQQQWRPPADLAAPLRYRLTLAPDGTITAVEPLNDLSATYQNTPALPQPGTQPPGLVRDEDTTVEVQFLPSGEVVVVPPGESQP